MNDKVLAVRLKSAEYIDPAHPGGALTRNLALEETALADPADGEVLVEPLYVSVCGSDSSASLGKPNFSWVQRPRTIGHEFCGRIVAFGPRKSTSDSTEIEMDFTKGDSTFRSVASVPSVASSSGLKVGDLVTAIPQRGCQDPRCRGCRRGRWNYCRRKQILGFHRDGAMARRVVLEADRLVPLRYGLTPLQGAVVEPLSVVAQALRRKCSLQPGMDVVVSGCGIIGLMAAELARAAGARVAITGVERDREVRLKFAEKRGFIPIVVSAERPLHAQLKAGVHDANGRRFGDEYEDGTADVLLECSGAPAALSAAGLAVQLEGTLCVVATYPTTVVFEATPFVRAGQVMTGVMGSSREDFETAQILLRDGLFRVEDYAQIYPLERGLEALADSMSARTPKAILEVNKP